jgi:vacuolar iron transporter family protein
MPKRHLGVSVTAVALIIFGGVKRHFTSINKAKSAGQTLLVGGPPAPAACGLAHASANLICRLLQ